MHSPTGSAPREDGGRATLDAMTTPRHSPPAPGRLLLAAIATLLTVGIDTVLSAAEARPSSGFAGGVAPATVQQPLDGTVDGGDGTIRGTPPGGIAAPVEGVWPLFPRPDVVADFDPPTTRYGPGHRGVDLRGRPGQPVRAALAGRVTFAGKLAGRGVVVVSHGERRTTYEPVAASVSRGEHVSRGEPIGVLERSPASHCRPATCLHWGLLRGETYLDPLTLVGSVQVRLLPYL